MGRKHERKMNHVISVALAVVLSIMAFGCGSDDSNAGYVRIDNGVFKIDGETFFPLMLNYKVGVMNFDGDIKFCASKHYDNPDIFEPKNSEEADAQFGAHMQLIKQMGFNTVRLCIDVILNSEDGNYYKTQDSRVFLKEQEKELVDAVEDMVQIASGHGLKVMLLLKPSWDNELAGFNDAVMKRLSGDRAVFAFDLMNEPLYFDVEKDRPKEDAVELVSKWVKTSKRAAPNHLVTIGFSEPIEVFSWDPSMMPVDFVEIHTYHPLRIPNEIWWYSHYVGKPWMIGETSLPADNDSVSYELQETFVQEAYQYTIDCGGIGFGWWEFQDMPDTHFEAKFSGLLNHEGTTATSSGYIVEGTLKPAAAEFAGLHSLEPKKPVRNDNYFNMLGYCNAVIKGRVVDDATGEPVECAVVRGWSHWWTVGMNTYTDENGCFTLFCNDACEHFAMSAPGMSVTRFDAVLDYFDENDTPACFDNMPNKELEYQSISYYPFLKNENSLFDFRDDMFGNARLHAVMPDVVLQKIQ